MSLNIIPQLFYDFISIIIPGFITLVGIYFTTIGPKTALNNIFSNNSEYNFSNFWIFLFIIIISYIVGFLLQQLSDLLLNRFKVKNIKHIYKKCTTDYFELDQLYQNIKNKQGNKFNIKKDPDYFAMSSQLQLIFPEEMKRILKLRAEARMSQSLVISVSAIGISNIIIIFLLLIFPSFKDIINICITDSIILICIAIFSFLCFLGRMKNKEKLYFISTFYTWLFYHFPFDKNHTNHERRKS